MSLPGLRFKHYHFDVITLPMLSRNAKLLESLDYFLLGCEQQLLTEYTMIIRTIFFRPLTSITYCFMFILLYCIEKGLNKFERALVSLT